MSGTIRIELNNSDTSCLPNGFDFTKNDTKLLAITKNIAEGDKKITTILVTKDLYMAIKSDSLGIVTQDYQNDKVNSDELYKGHRKITLSSKDMDEIQKGSIAMPSDFDFTLFPNEFLDITSSSDENYEMIAKFNGNGIVPLKYSNEIKRKEVSVDNFIEKLRKSGVIETKTFTYMRGRTLSDALVIVDESLQTTPHLAKLMLTRAGFGS